MAWIKSNKKQSGGGSSYTDVTGTLTAGQTQMTLTVPALTTDSTIDVYANKSGIPYPAIEISGYIVSTFNDGKIIVAESNDRAERKLYVVGLTKETTGITISDTDLLTYLSDIADGYCKGSKSYDSSSSSIQSGWLILKNVSGTITLETYTTAWTNYLAGTFYALIDLTQPPVSSSGTPSVQTNAYSEPPSATDNSITLTFPVQSENLGVKVRIS